MAESWRVVLASGEVREVECLYIGTVALAKVYGLRAEGVAVSGQGDNFIEAILDLARDGALRIVEILAPGEMTRAELAAQLAAVTAERDALAPLVTEARRVMHFAQAVVSAWAATTADAGEEWDGVAEAIRTLADEAGDWTLAGPHTTHDALAKACDDARAERDALRAERDGEHDLIARQAAILTAVADALKGPPPALSSHSHHDLGAVAAATVAQQAPLLDAHDALVAAARAAGWRDAGATGESLVAWVRRGERERCVRIAKSYAGPFALAVSEVSQCALDIARDIDAPGGGS